jgi:hypothetical protein
MSNTRKANGSIPAELSAALFSELNRMVDLAARQGYGITVLAAEMTKHDPKRYAVVVTGEDGNVVTQSGDGLLVLLASALKEAIEWRRANASRSSRTATATASPSPPSATPRPSSPPSDASPNGA